MLLLFRSRMQNGDGVAAAVAGAAGAGLAVLPGNGIVACVAMAVGTGRATLPGSGTASAVVIAVGNGSLVAIPITYYFQADTDDGRVFQHEQRGTGSLYRHEPADRGGAS